MDEATKRRIVLVLWVLLGTLLGGVLGGLGGALVLHFAGPVSRSAGGLLLLLLLLNPCAHVGAALGCALAWKRAAKAAEPEAGWGDGKLAPRPEDALALRGARILRRTLGGSLAGGIVVPIWLHGVDEMRRFIPREEGAVPWYVVGVLVGPPLGALLGCAQGLLGDRGAPGPGPAPAKGGFLGLTASTPIPYALGWVLVVGLLVCAGFLPPFGLIDSKISSNETSAISTLRGLASCQAQIQTSGEIDCDGDGIGEFGTFLELTGSVPLRAGFIPGKPAGSDFSRQVGKVTPQGKSYTPAYLSPALAGVNEQGIVRKSGYCFIVYLPDTSRVAGFVHESGPAATPRVSRPIGVDLSETTWCAYAWPVAYGNSGFRCFFVNQAGDVLQAGNWGTKWSGTETPMAPDSAFLGSGITASPAFGTRGRDGNLWKITN